VTIGLASRGVGRLSTIGAFATAVVVWVILLAPLGVLVTHSSWHSIRTSLAAPGALDPLWTSLEAGGVALGLMVGLGTPLAYLLARRRLPAPRLVEAGVVLPLLMPPLVLGLLLIFLIGRAGPIGRAISSVSPNVIGPNTFFALVVAMFYESAPYFVLAASAAFSAVDVRLEQDARLLGDSAAGAFRRITLPLAAPGVAVGLAIAWARAMAAFGAVLIVAYNPTSLPLAIRNEWYANGFDGAMPLALLLVVAALPLPLLAFLWSSRAGRSRRAVLQLADA
jgi:molybdate/tungstate transport system permease protein